jgi:hypothetical protein
MESINQEKGPSLSIVEQKKGEASKFIAGRIEEVKSEKGISILDAARQVYEEVKGQDYRKEQAAVKLLELLNLQNDIALREKEITGAFPALSHLVSNSTANDEKYLVAA